ncbi:MAG TPA: EAL domain-containing protein [Candidatus Limnocylindria bacterium]|nr:EAL domain-containing protein [Candidatus Limnocylindria bacterium]
MAGPVVGLVPTASILLVAALLGMRAAGVAAALLALANTLLYQAIGLELTVAFGASIVAAAFCLGIGLIIARLRSDKQRIERLTTFDRLTQLPNRDVFAKRLQKMVAAGGIAHVAVVDVFGLRDVNESFGHDVGDDVIREIARRLGATFNHDLVARFGTGDFAVLAQAVRTDDVFAAHALDAFRAPFLIGGGLLNVEGRVGIARSPEHGETSTALMSAAESAARSARRLAAGWAIASPTRSRDSAQRLRILGDLRQALERNELRLHYQPIVDMTGANVLGFEALMRWQRNGEFVPPAQFIPLAEQAGLIVQLTDWVVGESFRQSAQWASVGHPLPISINVGAKAIGPSSNLETVIARAAAEHGVPASQLTVEVTETDVMTDPALASRTLAGIKKLGVRVALDDFGTGYSSLGYLNELPLDEVKIDRSFISRLSSDPQTSSIVRAAVDLSHALGLDAVAEGVEDKATLDRLRLLGFDRVQGYFIARPMPADAVLPWLQRYVAAPTVVTAPVSTLIPTPTVHDASTSTVLVVDDEHSLRVATHRILSSQGYNVLHAATASQALRICTEQRDAIDLVVTDIFLTDWRGHELAGRIREMQPHAKFLFVSGDPMASALVKGAPFLAKPFSKQQLIDRVGLVLA